MNNQHRPVEEIAEEVLRILPVFIRKVHSGIIQQMSLTPAQLFVLMFLEEHPVCRLGDISREMDIAPPTATGIVDRLERDGYLRRVPDEEDRRAVNISLTEKGVKFLKEMRRKKYERTCRILNMLTPEDRENYVRILKKLLEGVENV